jgi:phosphoglycolate phosphatase
MELKAVLFDLEGTLVDPLVWTPEAIARERRDVKKKIIDLGVPREALKGLNRHTLLRNKAFDWVDENLREKEAASFHGKLDDFIKPIELKTARNSKLYSDTLESLTSLSDKGVEMALVTNTSAEAADYLLRKFELDGFFRPVLTRNDVSRLKPDPEMILLALNQIKTPVKYLVGDSEYDAGAAKKAGLESIIIRRDGIKPPFNHDHFIRSLNQIESLICKK